jgi:hypothetical protein
MRDFPIDPELRIRARPPVVLPRTTEAVDFIRKVAVVTPDRVWQDLLHVLSGDIRDGVRNCFADVRPRRDCGHHGAVGRVAVMKQRRIALSGPNCRVAGVLHEDLPVVLDPHRTVDDNANTPVERREAVEG